MEINSNSASNTTPQSKKQKPVTNPVVNVNRSNNSNKNNPKAVNDDTLSNNNSKRSNKIKRLTSDSNMQLENNTKTIVKKQTVSVKSITKMNMNQEIKSSNSSSSSSSSNLSIEQNLDNKQIKTIQITTNTIDSARIVTMTNNEANSIRLIDENSLKNINFIKPSELFSNSNKIQVKANDSMSQIKQPTTECVSNKNENSLKKLEAEFENNYIFKVKKDSKQTDQPKYQCEICSYFCNSTDIVTKHISSMNHKNNLESMRIEMRVRDLEMPSDLKLSNLSSFLIDFYLKNVISTEKLNQRYDIFYKFKYKFLQKFPDAKVNMYGSTAYGICFDDSQVDIDISIAHMSSSQILKEVSDLIKAEMSDLFELAPLNTNMKSSKANSNQNLNKLSLETKESKILFNFTSELFKSAYKTSYLIKAYLELDERAKILAFCFRYIAKIAMIDKVDLCTLPPHAYILMAIYFLQKLNQQVLPVLHEKINSTKNPLKVNTQSPDTSQKSKSVSLSEDLLSENQTETNESSEEQSESDEVEHDWIDIRNFDVFKKNTDAYLNGKHWNSLNVEDVATLWLKLLAFYSIDFGFKKNFISVRSQRRIPKSDVKMYTKKLAIEDPFLFKQSLSRNLLTQTNKYIIYVMSKACMYFVSNTHSIKLKDESISVIKNVKIVERLIEDTGILDARKKNKDFNFEIDDDFNDDIEENESDDDVNEQDNQSEDEGEDDYYNYQENSDKLEDLLQKKTLKPFRNKSSRTSKSSESDSYYLGSKEYVKFEQKFNDNIDKILKLDFNSDSTNENSSIDVLEQNAQNEFKIVNNCVKDLVSKVVSLYEAIYEQVPNVTLKLVAKYEPCSPTIFNIFKLTTNSLGFQKCPPKMCSLCNKEGHLDKECPQDSLPQLEKLPEMSKNWREILDYVTIQIMEDNQQTKKEEADRNHLFDKIKSIVFKKFPDSNLSLFGSSNNGFGMKKSDLDICMTLDSNPGSGEKLSVNFKRIIRVIGSLFRQESEFDMVEERTSAKVPIVKFRHKKTNVEGDISLYNTLALQNTELIRSYAMIDERTKILGHVVKYFAKICNIGDASCGSLSSYAYIVMVIHYLMNTSPPVLPCLQKLNRENFPKKETSLNIDGWDCWFNKEIANLATTWPHYKKNKQSIGELWLGFLCYYTEQFDWNNNVVCIKDTDTLTRRSKNWTKHRLAIEDPFELSHNLAAGVSHKMGLFILRSFAKARFLFGNVIHDFRVEELRLNMEYFFNPKSLVDGIPPIGRNCFTCNKIGHQTRECPVALNMRTLSMRRARPNRRFNSENNEDSSTIICYRCKNSGHFARDCQTQNENRMQKSNTITNNISNGLADQRCYNCNQFGHFSRDCNLNKSKQIFSQSQQQQQQQHQQQQYQQQQQQQQLQRQQNYQKQIIKQQSAPQPKMIRIVNTTLNPPMIVKTGENNFQLLVNKSDQHNVYTDYQHFYLNQDKQLNHQTNSNNNHQQYQHTNDEIKSDSSKALKSSNSLVYNHLASFPAFNLNSTQFNQQQQHLNNVNKNFIHQNVNYPYQLTYYNNGINTTNNHISILNEVTSKGSDDLSQYLITNKKTSLNKSPSNADSNN